LRRSSRAAGVSAADDTGEDGWSVDEQIHNVCRPVNRAEHENVIYIKSKLVGIVALFATTVVYLVGTIVVLIHNYQPPPGSMVRITLPELLNRPKYWLIVLAAFAIGYWVFSQTSR